MMTISMIIHVNTEVVATGLVIPTGNKNSTRGIYLTSIGH